MSLAENQISTLSIAFLVGFLVSMWSANSGVRALFDELNVVHGSKETRGLLQFYTRTLAITLGWAVYGLLDARWRWVTLGSALAAVLLVAVSMVFTCMSRNSTVTIEFMAPWAPLSAS